MHTSCDAGEVVPWAQRCCTHGLHEWIRRCTTASRVGKGPSRPTPRALRVICFGVGKVVPAFGLGWGDSCLGNRRGGGTMTIMHHDTLEVLVTQYRFLVMGALCFRKLGPLPSSLFYMCTHVTKGKKFFCCCCSTSLYDNTRREWLVNPMEWGENDLKIP